MRQLAFDLGQRKALGREDFFVSPPNAEAVAWVDRWPDWPARALALHGPSGCGKTHLALVLRAKARGRLLPAADLDPAAVGEMADNGALVLEQADEAGERALLHLLNLHRERGGTILLTAESPPARWRVALPDLASRLAAAPAVSMGPPDDALLSAVLIKHFSDHQLTVAPEALAYIAARLERSFEAARVAAAALDQAALAERRAITIPLARRVLGFASNG